MLRSNGNKSIVEEQEEIKKRLVNYNPQNTFQTSYVMYRLLVRQNSRDPRLDMNIETLNG
jgi:hypothetical protein